MKCDSCRKEEQWLEIIGKEMICRKCLQKNKMMGYILKTNMDMFFFLIKKTKPAGYAEYLKVKREDVESLADLKKHGIILKKRF